MVSAGIPVRYRSHARCPVDLPAQMASMIVHGLKSALIFNSNPSRIRRLFTS